MTNDIPSVFASFSIVVLVAIGALGFARLVLYFMDKK
jgi:hypothetical protein